MLADFEAQHMLSSEVYHESNEQFSEGIQKDEGVVFHYARHFYLVGAMFLGINLAVKAYSFSFQSQFYYEDLQDQRLFEFVKR